VFPEAEAVAQGTPEFAEKGGQVTVLGVTKMVPEEPALLTFKLVTLSEYVQTGMPPDEYPVPTENTPTLYGIRLLDWKTTRLPSILMTGWFPE
jgi:hypothetical protein